MLDNLTSYLNNGHLIEMDHSYDGGLAVVVRARDAACALRLDIRHDRLRDGYTGRAQEGGSAA